MSPIQFVKIIAIVAAIGFIASVEARNIGEDIRQVYNQQQDQPSAASPYMYPMNSLSQQASNVDQNDADDDQDDDVAEVMGMQPQQLQAALLQAGSAVYQNERQPVMYNEQENNPQQQQIAQPTQQTDLKTSASHHHHGHGGAKGWLDMGAWTGKKGAFGWYDKHPVGKGK